jgi:hypothetical protein
MILAIGISGRERNQRAVVLMVSREEPAQVREATMIHVGILIGGVAIVALASSVSTAEDKAADASSKAASQRQPLDLRAPDVAKLYTPEEIERMVAGSIAKDIEEVEVQGERGRREPVTPRVWPGIAAPFWALLHPTQAWRIFSPLPPDQANSIGNYTPDATVGFLEPAAPPHP